MCSLDSVCAIDRRNLSHFIGDDLLSEIYGANNLDANAVEAVAADGGDLIILTEDVMAYIEEDLGENLIQEAVPQAKCPIAEAFAALQNLFNEDIFTMIQDTFTNS